MQLWVELRRELADLPDDKAAAFKLKHMVMFGGEEEEVRIYDPSEYYEGGKRQEFGRQRGAHGHNIGEQSLNEKDKRGEDRRTQQNLGADQTFGRNQRTRPWGDHDWTIRERRREDRTQGPWAFSGKWQTDG